MAAPPAVEQEQSPAEVGSTARPLAAPLGDLCGRLVMGAAGQRFRPFSPVVLCASEPGSEPEPSAPPPIHVALAHVPPCVVVQVGQEVHLENDDTICHDPFSTANGNAFEPVLLQPGCTRMLRFHHRGAVPIYCSLHTGRKTTFVVVPSRHFTIAGDDGDFSIPGLRPGLHRLETWGESIVPARLDVVISAGASAYVDVPVDAPPPAGTG